MTPAQARRLRAHEARLQQLASQLASSGFISSGSVVQRFMPCGKPGCRCQADPPQLHGPYWQWSRVVRGKTITRRLAEGQARLYQEWIANRRRLAKTLAEMDRVSQQAATILLQEVRTPAPADRDGGQDQASASPKNDPTLRVTERLAETLARLPELMDPVAEAAQEWLDAKDEGDRDRLAEARQSLATALAESGALLDAVESLARLAGPLQAPPPRMPGPPRSRPSLTG
jgi:hypothetical protein